MLCRQTKTLLLLFILTALTSLHAQYEVPDEIFQRTLLIRSGKQEATAFKFDQGGRIYLVTTRYFGKNLPLNNATVQAWHNQVWSDIPTVRTLFPASKDVDLAILETNEQVAEPYAVVKSSEVLTTGQPVWFMGWLGPLHLPTTMPANMPKTSRGMFPEIPLVKVGTISAIDPVRPDSFEIHFEGSTSARIAGGPIIYWSPSHRDFEIVAVIERNERDAVAVPINGNSTKSGAKSGMLKGYSIDIVVDAISNSPHS
jgi:hypothetical protein